jgi:hypothetical protein
MSQFQFEVEVADEVVTFKLSGAIDEDVVFPAVPTQVKKIKIHLAKVTLINSVGIREWIKWYSSFPQGCKVQYHFCPQPIIEQMNLVSGFYPSNAEIVSFYVPYLCQSCDGLTNILYENDKVQDGLKIQKVISCNKCRAQAELDVTPQRYFSFLKRAA